MKRKIVTLLIGLSGVAIAAILYFEMSYSSFDTTREGHATSYTKEENLSEESLSEELDLTEEQECNDLTNEKKVSEPNLYARSAVLMDADTGRVLYEKNGYQVMPMASTTKIMTCIIGLEYGHLDDIVTISPYAAKQPKVRLGMHAGEQFILRDLFYSLMLESHNDSAVAIAEHIGSALLEKEITIDTTEEQSKQYVQCFINMMNQKARDIGCFDTCFISPNGLDATMMGYSGECKTHATTAADLAGIMRYCIMESVKKDSFLEITRTKNTSFSNVLGNCTYNCANHNAFLTMMEGALSGKTGFTVKAGYCYVGALERNSKTFIVALLACGWPNNKGYKWSDTKKLMNYGLENYEYRNLCENGIKLEPISVLDGQKCSVALKVEHNPCKILMNPGEEIRIQTNMPKQLQAPVEKNEIVGNVNYYIGDAIVQSYPVYTLEKVARINYLWCLNQMIGEFFL